MRRSLTRAERLTDRRDIRAVIGVGQRVRGTGMRLHFVANGRAQNRIVVVPVKGFGNAVRRNRCRRHGKEAYRALKHRVRTGFDLVVLCFPGDYSFAERCNQLSNLLLKADLLDKEY